MQIAILQIGDLHIHGGNDEVVCRSSAVVAALRSIAPQLEACFVVVVGDIAFSGREAEYAAAAAFFGELRRGIEQDHPGIRPSLVFVPGNHDCNMEVATDVRDIDYITSKRGNLDLDGATVQHCLAVQKEYFSFAEQFGQLQNSTREQLCHRREFETETGRKVAFTLINTAWLTQNPERPGHLFFPTNVLTSIESTADLEICVFHHPSNWLEPNNALEFQAEVEGRSDFILTGHQHVDRKYRKANESGADVYYVEGMAMADNEASSVGFNLIDIDTTSNTWSVYSFEWDTSKYTSKPSTTRRPFLRNRILEDRGFKNTPDFSAFLNQIGAGFTHPRAKEIRLTDLFVYPAVTQRVIQSTIEQTKPSLVNIQGQDLLDHIRSMSYVLLVGDDKVGKTVLAKKLYVDLQRDCRLLPIYVDGRTLTPQDVRDVPSLVRQLCTQQYGSNTMERFMQLESADRAVIVDDLDSCALTPAARQAFVVRLESIFSKVVVFVGIRFDIDVIVGQTDRPVFAKYRQYVIAEMGHLLRAKLISKWVALGRDEYELDLTYHQEVRRRENLIQTLLGKQLLPSYPIIILGILQAFEATGHVSNASGSYGELFEALITDRLASVSAKATDMGTRYIILSRLAYRMFKQGTRFLESAEVHVVNDEYFHDYRVRIDMNVLVADLKSAGVLEQRQGNILFRYEYYYHFFVARYFRDNISDPSQAWALRGEIREMAERLYFEEYAHVLMFYLYLTKDIDVITQLLNCARRIFRDLQPCDLDSDVAAINALYISPPKPIELPSADIERNQDEYRSRMDEIDNNTGTVTSAGAKLPYSDDLDDIVKFYFGMRILYLLGQVVRNFPGSLRHNIKTDITRECYLLGLRMLSLVLKSVDQHQDLLRTYFARMIRDQRAVVRTSELPRSAEEAILKLVETWAFGMIKMISQSVGMPELDETYRDVMSEHGKSLAVRCIDASIRLDHFVSFPEKEVRYLHAHTRHNIFAGCLLRDLVAHYFYLFQCDSHIRDTYGRMLKIEARKSTQMGLQKET